MRKHTVVEVPVDSHSVRNPRRKLVPEVWPSLPATAHQSLGLRIPHLVAAAPVEPGSVAVVREASATLVPSVMG